MFINSIPKKYNPFISLIISITFAIQQKITTDLAEALVKSNCALTNYTHFPLNPLVCIVILLIFGFILYVYNNNFLEDTSCSITTIINLLFFSSSYFTLNGVSSISQAFFENNRELIIINLLVYGFFIVVYFSLILASYEVVLQTNRTNYLFLFLQTIIHFIVYFVDLFGLFYFIIVAFCRII